MESPERRGLWDTIEDVERRAVLALLTPAESRTGPLSGEDGTGRSADRPQRPAGAVPGQVRPAAEGEGQRAAPPVVIVAPGIAVAIVSAFSDRTGIAALARQWHLTRGEVMRVITGQPAAQQQPDVAPEVWADPALAAVLLRGLPPR